MTQLIKRSGIQIHKNNWINSGMSANHDGPLGALAISENAPTTIMKMATAVLSAQHIGEA